MEFDKLLNSLSERFPGKINGQKSFGHRFVTTEEDVLKQLLSVLKSDYGFDYLADIVATHWPKRKQKFDLSYNLFNVDKKIRIFVKCAISDAKAATVADVWKSAIFLEREQFDLVGVVFEGNPDLRRILLPDFFEGHPLRKEFPLKERKWFNKTDEQGLGISFTK